MYGQLFKNQAAEFVNVIEKSFQTVYGTKAGTRTNLEFVKKYFEQYLEELSAAIALLNDQDHSIVISNLKDTQTLIQEAVNEVDKQLNKNNNGLY